jgi:signal transduction histidine kinase
MAFFILQSTQREFDQFVTARNIENLGHELAAYYQATNSWQGVEEIFEANASSLVEPDGRPLALSLADDQGRIVFVRDPIQARFQVGQTIRDWRREFGSPIKIDNQIVGRLLLSPSTPPPNRDRGSPEADFLARMTQAILYSALAASALALLIGVILARTISRPVRELTLATRAMATGNLNQKVKVRSKDELGELASSFNQMSTDLVESNRQRRQMTADIAHDLRTPLSVILGYTEALSDAKLQGTPDIFEVIHDEAQHLSHLIEDLRTLSLADAGELTIVLRPTPPQSLLERTAAAHRVQVQQQDVSLEVETPADLPEVAVDPERMAQVLGNLVSNALRYTPQNGRIVLSAQAQADDLLLQVRDSGSGIASEDLPHIFERFYRSDKSRTQNGQSGLGLPIAKSLVEMHGGTLSAESVPGQGTTFTIRLPLTRPAPA